MSQPYLLGFDQGTSGSKAVIIDKEGKVWGFGNRPLKRFYPQPGWVEQEPYAVAEGVSEAITEAIGQAGCHPNEIAACGITSQRNTEFAWDKRDGRPLSNAITWQDLRSIPILQELENWPLYPEARQRLGYPPGAYMSAVHLAWRMRHQREVRAASESGYLQLGLSAAWLLQVLGKPVAHQMDTSLVQAMGLYDFRAKEYWQEWIDWVGVANSALPAPMPTLHEYGSLTVTAPNGQTAEVPVRAMIGDQQSALFGHGCRQPGDAECTHGTASYVKVFLDDQAPAPENINVYFAWHLGDKQTYCLEAPTTVTGAAMRWMRDNAVLFDEYEEMDSLAAGVADVGGLAFVPAFTGLDVPYNNPEARAAIFGLTLGHHRGHIARAFFESIGYQLRTILETITNEAALDVKQLVVGGGVSASDIACQIQADLLNIPVVRPTFVETTSWAAALLAGLGVGKWSSVDSLPSLPGSHDFFYPSGVNSAHGMGYQRWQKAVYLVGEWSKIAPDPGGPSAGV